MGLGIWHFFLPASTFNVGGDDIDGLDGKANRFAPALFVRSSFSDSGMTSKIMDDFILFCLPPADPAPT